MMKKLGILIFGLMLLTGKLHAGIEGFDIFGVDDKTQQKIISTCSEMIVEYSDVSKKVHFTEKPPSEKDVNHMKALEKKIIAKVKQLGDFEVVKISVVYYPTEQTQFATLDLVRIGDIERMPKKQMVVAKKKSVKSKELAQLFTVWNTYDDNNNRLLIRNQYDSTKKKCPVMHCTWGFDAVERKEILPKLQKGVAKHKKELMDIVKNTSLNEAEREQSVFILANDTNYQEMASFLINFTDDPSEGVRNNTMRVLAAIAAKHKIKDLDISRIFKALNYPYVTDRNKASYVLLGVVQNDPSTHATVIMQSGQSLLELLKLKQPNNHDFAYSILRVLSNKNYGERDYKHWEQWIKQQQDILSKAKG